MTSMHANDHAWFRRHLPDHLLDLLVDEDRERFEAHARRCGPCARLLSSARRARDDWWDGAGHPPVGVLLAWDEAAAGPVHDAVREHLGHCESCREDVAELLGPEVAARIAPAPASPARRARRGEDQPWRHLTAVAAVLAVVTATVVLWPRAVQHAPAPEAGPAPGLLADAPAGDPTDAPAPAAEPPAARAAGPVTILSAERGAQAAATTLRLAAGVASVALTLPALFVDDDASLEVELRDAAGALVHRQVLAAGPALRPGGVVLPASELASGAYVLHVRWTEAGGGESARAYALDVRVSR